jgi:uncharacterized protein
VIVGLGLFYKLNVHRTIKLQNNMKGQTPMEEKIEVTKGRVVFFDSNNRKKIEISVKIAENAYQQKKGLMFAESIPENEGMLFTYDDELQRFFWMKNTSIPLDMIFIDGRYRIVKIHINTEPLSENVYPSGTPAQFVVEVRAGFTEKNQIIEGDRISWEKF